MVEDPLGLLRGILETVGNLLSSYLTKGTLFLAVHILVLYLFWQKWREIQREAKELESWKPGDFGKSSCTGVLSSFVAENEQLARQGFLVPLTDFTDRLDSYVDGLVGRMHDLINLLLVVGIAGTTFSFFEVARQNTQQPIADTSRILEEGLTTAFPVVFWGLVFYVVCHLVSQRPEGRLRDAISSATELALRRRRGIARSQANVIEEGLKPLRTLEKTLGDIVQPVINEFKKRLDQTYEITSKQMETLHEGVESVRAAVDSVGHGVKALQETTDNLRGLLGESPKVIRKLDGLYEQHAETLRTLVVAVDEVRNSISQTTKTWGKIAQGFSELEERFHVLPENISTSVEKTLTAAASSIPEIYREATAQLRSDVVNIIGGIKEATANTSRVLTGAANQWHSLGQNARVYLQQGFEEALTKVAERAHEDLARVDQVFGQKYPKAVSDFDRMIKDLESLKATLKQVNEVFEKLLGQIKIAAAQIDTEGERKATREALLQVRKDLGKNLVISGEILDQIQRPPRRGGDSRPNSAPVRRTSGDGIWKRVRGWFGL